MPSRRTTVRALGSAALTAVLAGCSVLDDGPAAAEWRASTTASPTRATLALSTGLVATSGRFDGGSDGRVDAFDADSGERLWRSAIEEPTGLAADGDLVYAGRRRPGGVLAFDVEGGDREWTADVDNLASSLAVAGGTVYAANGTLAAIDTADGTVRWERSGVDDVDFSVTVAPSDMLAATRDGVVFADDAGAIALAAADGSVRWRWRADEWESATAGPYVYDDRVFVGGNERGRVVALNRGTGDPAWERSLDGAATVVGFHAQNRHLVVATRTGSTDEAGAGTVHVLNRRQGTTERTLSFDAPPTNAASAGDRFVLALADGTVVGLDVGWDAPERWRASLPGTEPAVATDGEFGYAHTDEGTLWALNEP